MKKKKSIVIIIVIIGSIIFLSLISFYIKNLDFANEIYAKCLDTKNSSIRIDNLYGDSYKVLQDCNKVRSKAFFFKESYEKCIKEEKSKMGFTFEDYIKYIYGGYNTQDGCTGYYLCKPYEEYAKLYEDENKAYLSAYSKMETKCLNELIK